jgi:peptide chain release factor 1
VTVAVFEALEVKQFRLDERDIEVFTTKDSGPGGQHRNKTESCVVMRHKPTGIEAKAASKSQHDNRKTARSVLESRVAKYYGDLESSKMSGDRKRQVGSGMRGDKIRTYREQDNQVSDHASGKKARLSDVRVGAIDKLWM